MGKRYLNYKQARQSFLKPAMEHAAKAYLSGIPKRAKKVKKLKAKKYAVPLSGQTVTGRMKVGPPEIKPLKVNISVDISEVTAALEKLGQSMAKGARVIVNSMSQGALKGLTASISFNHSMSAVEACLQAEQRFTRLQCLGWIRDPEGGLVSPQTLDIVDPAILDDEHDFELFLSVYMHTGTIPNWVPCHYVVEKLALPLDSVRKQLEGRISEQTGLSKSIQE